MRNKKMLDYIANERARGISDEAIKDAFTQKGWTKKQIDNLFAPPKQKINWATYFIGSSLFRGRINNVRYAVIFVLAVIMNYIYIHTDSTLFKVAALMLFFIFGIGIGIRRFHDINKSGFWVLTFFIPILGLLIGLWLCYKKGNPDANHYGEPEESKRNFLKSLLNI